MTFLYLFHNRVKLAVFGFVYNVRHIFADNRLVGRNFDNVHAVNFTEFLLLGHRGTGHTGQLFIHTEQVLVGDGRKCLGFAFYLNAFLCLDCLMQTLAVTASVHDTSGKFVNDHNLVVLYHVVNVALHCSVRFDCLIDVVLNGGVFHIHQVFQAEIFLGLLHAGFGQGCGLCLFVYDIVRVDDVVVFFLVVQLFHLVHFQGSCKAVGNLVQVGGLVASAGDDKRSSRLVD